MNLCIEMVSSLTALFLLILVINNEVNTKVNYIIVDLQI